MSETNKAVIRSFVRSVNAQDWDSVRKMVVPQFVRHSDAGGVLKFVPQRN
jgi:hypothetical protein